MSRSSTRPPRQPRYSIRPQGRSRRNGRRSLSENARALALINMAINDSLVASFFNKYHYNFWRPETAIHAGDTDGNPKTDADPNWVPFIATPCFPSYPSNHGSAANAAAEVMRRLYGEAGHSITLSNPAVPTIVLQYTIIQADYRRHLRRSRLRRDTFSNRPGSQANAWDSYRQAVYKHNLRRMQR